MRYKRITVQKVMQRVLIKGMIRMKSNCLNVFQRNNCVVIKINDGSEFDDIEKEIKKKVTQLKKIYKDDKTPIKVTGRTLKNKEIEKIETIIKNILDVDVEFDMPREMGLSNIKKTFLSEISTSETKFHKGSLRSGQRLEEERSIVILGDVNSGAEVIASDNIVVLGTLRGLAHAGAKGNKQAIIAAGRLDTVQMRIANIVKEFNREEEPLRKLSYAYVEDDKIIIE